MSQTPDKSRTPGKPNGGAKRRGFLKFLGLGGVVGTAATMLGTRAQAAIVAEPEEGYRETEHVHRYYESARF